MTYLKSVANGLQNCQNSRFKICSLKTPTCLVKSMAALLRYNMSPQSSPILLNKMAFQGFWVPLTTYNSKIRYSFFYLLLLLLEPQRCITAQRTEVQDRGWSSSSWKKLKNWDFNYEFEIAALFPDHKVERSDISK